MEISFLDFSRVAADRVREQFAHASQDSSLSEATLASMQKISVLALGDCFRSATKTLRLPRPIKKEGLNNLAICLFNNREGDFSQISETIFITETVAARVLQQLEGDLKAVFPCTMHLSA